VPLRAGIANNRYVVFEGQPIHLDGTDSRPPEADDRIARYEWDVDGDGRVDAEGATVDLPPRPDGLLSGRLRVTDGLGETASTPFRIDVLDVDPAADPGGPYRVAQGTALTFDASRSRAGAATDPIREYAWSWGDGTPEQSGADLVQPKHVFDRDGGYDVRLTVRDQDSEASVVTRVEVTDVDPVVTRLDAPVDPYELTELTFTADARPGAAADPVVRYEWFLDFDFAHPLAAGPDARVLHYRFRDAGRHSIAVRAWDPDSSALRSVELEVRPITLAELLQETATQVRTLRQADALLAPVIAELDIPGDPRRIEDFLANGLWGERHGYRGNTLLAIDAISLAMGFAIEEGADFGELPWAYARQLQRELGALRAQVAARGVPADHPDMVQADRLLAAMQQDFAAPDFEADVNRRLPMRLRQHVADAETAYFHLTNAIDPCNQFGEPRVDDAIVDPLQRVAAANGTNDLVRQTLSGMADEMGAYVDAGADAGDPGPGRPRVQDALAAMQPILLLSHLPVGILCGDGGCISDTDALRLELGAMDLVGHLNAMGVNGVWTRNWEACLVEAVRFRVELSMLRVEYVCGANTEVATRAREHQRNGLRLLQQGQIEAALDYYASPDQRCLAVRTYNECLATTDPTEDPPFPKPAICP
jgi:PKD repeat protein